MLRALVAAALLTTLVRSKRTKRPHPQAAPIPLVDDAPIEDRLKAAILTHDNNAVAELLAASPPPDLDADTGSESDAVKDGYLPPGRPLMAGIFASNTKAIAALLAAGADGNSGGPSHHMLPAETAAFRADPYALAALHKGGVDVTQHGPHGFGTFWHNTDMTTTPAPAWSSGSPVSISAPLLRISHAAHGGSVGQTAGLSCPSYCISGQSYRWTENGR